MLELTGNICIYFLVFVGSCIAATGISDRSADITDMLEGTGTTIIVFGFFLSGQNLEAYTDTVVS